MISIIVPIYHCRKYMDKMLQSILSQTYSDFQLILADDGSTDGSLELALEYVKKDSRIEVVTQSHSGVAAVRNTALNIVKGEYILFVDGDDYIEPELLEKLISECKNKNIDSISYMFRRIGENGDLLFEMHTTAEEYLLNNGSDIIYYLLNSKGPKYSVCGTLFSTDIIQKNHIRFQEDLYLGEDTLFLWEYLMCCDRIRLIDYVGYNYIKRPQSLTTTYCDDWNDKINQQFISFRCLYDFVFSRNKRDFIIFLAYKGWLIINDINAAYQKTKNREKLKQYRKSNEIKKLIYPIILKNAPLRRKIMTLIFIMSPYFFNRCMKLLHWIYCF